MEYKLIIFDLDGTLYNLDDVLPMVYQTQIEYLQSRLSMNREQIITLFEENHIYPYKSANAKSATELFLKMGVNREDWSAFRNEKFNEEYINPQTAVSKETISAYAKLCPLVLISSNTYANIQKILRRIDIPITLFTKILCSDHCNGVFHKSVLFTEAVNLHKVSYAQTLAIGDRFSTDVEPMLKLGGRGVIIKSPCALGMLLKDMQQDTIVTNDAYLVY